MANRERIVSLKKATWDYLEASRIAAKRGMRLPSNVLHDEYLNKTGEWEGVKDIYPAFAREILVYPRIGRKFAKGRDVIDSVEDCMGRRWRLPASYVKNAHMHNEVYGIRDVSLFIEPFGIEEKSWKVTVHPATITIMYNVAALNSMIGRMNEVTGLPEKTAPGRPIPAALRRRLIRNEGAGVRPIIRGIFGYYADARRDIVAGDGFSIFCRDGREEMPYARFRGYGVAGVTEDKVRFSITKKSNRLIVEGTPEMLDIALRRLEGLK